MDLKLAYLSQGKLFFKLNDLAVRQIDSRFGHDVINRTIQRQQRNEWKTQGQGTPFGGAMLWGVTQGDQRAIHVQISGVTNGTREGEMLFGLETEGVGGLFLYDWSKDEERRLFHKENLRIRDLARQPETDLVACSQYFPNGTANIAVIKGTELHQITEGDSLDEAPAWLPGARNKLVFQSAGLARNAQGYAVGLGPFAIHALNLDTGTLATLLEDPKFDFLCPRMNAEGDLFFIRRPYETPGRSHYPITGLLADVVLFPFRLSRALFHFLNFMSLTFSRKPLTTAAGPKVEAPDQKTLLLRGRIIDAEKALRESAQNEIPSLVPPTWELIKRRPSGEENLVAKSVAAFDLDLDGNLVYSNGTAIFRSSGAGTPQLLVKGKLIENLTIIR